MGVAATMAWGSAFGFSGTAAQKCVIQDDTWVNELVTKTFEKDSASRLWLNPEFYINPVSQEEDRSFDYLIFLGGLKPVHKKYRSNGLLDESFFRNLKSEKYWDRSWTHIEDRYERNRSLLHTWAPDVHMFYNDFKPISLPNMFRKSTLTILTSDPVAVEGPGTDVVLGRVKEKASRTIGNMGLYETEPKDITTLLFIRAIRFANVMVNGDYGLEGNRYELETDFLNLKLGEVKKSDWVAIYSKFSKHIMNRCETQPFEKCVKQETLRVQSMGDYLFRGDLVLQCHENARGEKDAGLGGQRFLNQEFHSFELESSFGPELGKYKVNTMKECLKEALPTMVDRYLERDAGYIEEKTACEVNGQRSSADVTASPEESQVSETKSCLSKLDRRRRELVNRSLESGVRDPRELLSYDIQAMAQEVFDLDGKKRLDIGRYVSLDANQTDSILLDKESEANVYGVVRDILDHGDGYHYVSLQFHFFHLNSFLPESIKIGGQVRWHDGDTEKCQILLRKPLGSSDSDLHYFGSECTQHYYGTSYPNSWFHKEQISSDPDAFMKSPDGNWRRKRPFNIYVSVGSHALNMIPGFHFAGSNQKGPYVAQKAYQSMGVLRSDDDDQAPFSEKMAILEPPSMWKLYSNLSEQLDHAPIPGKDPLAKQDDSGPSAQEENAIVRLSPVYNPWMSKSGDERIPRKDGTYEYLEEPSEASRVLKEKLRKVGLLDPRNQKYILHTNYPDNSWLWNGFSDHDTHLFFGSASWVPGAGGPPVPRQATDIPARSLFCNPVDHYFYYYRPSPRIAKIAMEIGQNHERSTDLLIRYGEIYRLLDGAKETNEIQRLRNDQIEASELFSKKFAPLQKKIVKVSSRSQKGRTTKLDLFVSEMDQLFDSEFQRVQMLKDQILKSNLNCLN